MNKLKYLLAFCVIFVAATVFAANNIVRLGPEYFPTASIARPIAGGQVYVGIPDTDPSDEANQKPLYVQQEDGTIVEVTQPLTLSAGGVAQYDGSPVTILVDGDYSLLVLTAGDSQIYYVPSSAVQCLSPGNYCYPSSSASDHGVTGDSNTIKYCVDTIGTTNKATVYLRHDSGLEWTDYVYSTSDDYTANTNITFIFEKGARLDPDSGKTITLPAPENIGADIRQQIKTGDGTIAFAYPGRFPVQWLGADNNESTYSDEATLNAAITAAAAGSMIYFPGGSQYYKLDTTDLVTIDKALTFEGDGESSEIRQTASHGIFDITAPNVTIRNLKLYGKQSIAAATNENAIMAYGPDKDNYISHVNLENVWIENWGYRGLRYTFVENFTIKNVYMEDIWIAGMSFSSSRYGSVDHCTVRDMTNTAGNAWNYTCTRTEDDSIETYPRCKDITFTACKAYDNELWTAFDTHGGDGIKWVGCTAYNCRLGVAIGSSDNGSNVGTFAPLNCQVVGGVFESAVTGTASYGLTITGAAGAGGVGSPTELAKGCGVVGATFKGYGNESEALGCAVYLRTTAGLVLNGLKIVEPSAIGILLYYDNYGFSINGGSIIDVWSDTNKAYGIEENANYNYGTIQGVSFLADDKDDDTPTYLNARAIQIGNNANTKIVIGTNYSAYSRYLGGTMTNVVPDNNAGEITLKDVFGYADFSTAGASNTHNFIVNIPAGSIVTDVWWTLDEVFAGGSCSAATLSIGPTANDDGFIVDTNVFTGASTGYQTSDVTARGDELYSGGVIQYFTTAATTLRASLEIVDDTIDNLTSGQATFWVRYYKIN